MSEPRKYWWLQPALLVIAIFCIAIGQLVALRAARERHRQMEEIGRQIDRVTAQIKNREATP